MQKLDIIEKGASAARVCEQYGVKMQTVSGVGKSKDKLMKCATSYCVDASTSKSGEV